MLLAVDTSTRWTGLALYDGAQVIAESCWSTQNHHTVELAPAVDRLLRQIGAAPKEVECLAAATGPGSFTSLRIGLAFVKGMALSLRVPVVGVPTLDALAVSIPLRPLPLVAVLQAGRGRLGVVRYRAESRRWEAQGDPQVTTAELLAESIEETTLVAGELNEDERRILNRKRKVILLASPAESARRPGYLAEIAWARYQAGRTDDPVSLAPIYLHVAEVIPS